MSDDLIDTCLLRVVATDQNRAGSKAVCGNGDTKTCIIVRHLLKKSYGLQLRKAGAAMLLRNVESIVAKLASLRDYFHHLLVLNLRICISVDCGLLNFLLAESLNLAHNFQTLIR